MKSLADFEPFRTVLAASDDQIERQRHMEYVSRFLVHTYVPYDGRRDVEEYIDDGIIELAGHGIQTPVGARFRETFEALDEAFGGDVLRRIDGGQHQGRVSLAAFECIAVGVSKNIDAIRRLPKPVDFLRSRIQDFWQEQQLPRFFAPGLRGTVRIQRTIPFGEQMFRP